MRNILVILMMLPTLIHISAEDKADVTEVQPTNEQTVADLPVMQVAVEDIEFDNSDVEVTRPDSHFAWGVDLGAAFDMTTHDMSMFDIHANFGWRGGIMRFIGIGAGINMMMSNSSRSYPVYAMARTSFSTEPKLSFLDLRAGMAFNSIESYKSRTDPYLSVGWGVTLASSEKFTSHIILSYMFMPLGDGVRDGIAHHLPDLHFASLRIGASF